MAPCRMCSQAISQRIFMKKIAKISEKQEVYELKYKIRKNT